MVGVSNVRKRPSHRTFRFSVALVGASYHYMQHAEIAEARQEAAAADRKPMFSRHDLVLLGDLDEEMEDTEPVSAALDSAEVEWQHVVHDSLCDFCEYHCYAQ